MCALIVSFLIFASFFVICPCMLSSLISRWEEQRGKED